MQLQLCRKLAAKHGDPYAHLARRNVDLVDGADGAFHRTGGDLNRITDLVLDLKVNMFGRETPAEVELGQVELP